MRFVGKRRGGRVSECKAVVVEDRDAFGVEPRHAGRDERPDAFERRVTEYGAGLHGEANGCRGRVRRFICERARLRRSDDDACFRNAGEAAQTAREVARETLALLRIEHRLRRQGTCLLQCVG